VAVLLLPRPAAALFPFVFATSGYHRLQRGALFSRFCFLFFFLYGKSQPDGVYFFEIEQEEGLKQYGYSKEHRPNPLVQMGLFMDAQGIPLAFSINKGDTNEQTTLKPLEKKILSDFGLSKFVVCTDAGLSSIENRLYNDMGGRAFITTQSIKKLKQHLKNWALDVKDWHIAGRAELFNITQLDEESHKDSTFYKERWIKEDGLEQKLIVTYSIKYRNYQRRIRAGQVERAQK